jgi:hypothetical protein
MKITSIEVAAAIIGVSSDATKEEIDSAYKQRARLLHPDRFDAGSKQQETANESMQQLNEARDFMANYKPSKTPPTASSGYSQPSPSTEAEPTYVYREMTDEEIEEERVRLRNQQIIEEKQYRQFFTKELIKYGVINSVLLILGLVNVYFIATVRNPVMFYIFLAVVFIILVPMVKRLIDRWYGLIDSLQRIRGIKVVDRKESKAFKKNLKRKKK